MVKKLSVSNPIYATTLIEQNDDNDSSGAPLLLPANEDKGYISGTTSAPFSINSKINIFGSTFGL